MHPEHRSILTPDAGYGRGTAVGRARGDGFDLGVGVIRGVELGVEVTVGVDVGEIVAVGVAVGVDVGVGVGVSPTNGAWIATVIGAPVLKNPTVALTLCGGTLASNRKLYSVPQRIALAFWFCANVSQFQVMRLLPG